MVRATKQKEDWESEGAEVYFIDNTTLAYNLFEGRIEKDNGDGTFVVKAVCRSKFASKDPVTMTVP